MFTNSDSMKKQIPEDLSCYFSEGKKLKISIGITF